jgi:hypothetical protein
MKHMDEDLSWEDQEKIFDLTGEYHPAVGGRYVPIKSFELVRHIYQARISELEKQVADAKRERDNALSDWRQSDVDSLRALHSRNVAREQRDNLVNAIEAWSKKSWMMCECNYGHDGRMPLQGEKCQKCKLWDAVDAALESAKRPDTESST